MNRISFSSFPILVTERFALRQLTLEDDNEIFFLRSDNEVNKYLDRPTAKIIEDARQFINKINTSIAKNESIYWAVSLKDNPKLIGTVCLWNISDDGSNAEIGFELLPEFKGRGIMQEVIPVVINYAFGMMKLKSIDGQVDLDNVKSIKLMEKNGFTLREKLENTAIYSLHNPIKMG